ncbi:replication-associated recombination protein A [Limnobacter parvus]|uniref:Replication-associated recombination protein A n=1 Tax=Limnobacter parvus TaxID=2939690 RepID=A0ABT1XJE5_9BURK|nr:replication-associated recombination protein A [Limnobacter parvus]MCR2747001.1 replication-associated recombination protein A [Limnobacter parvus]
MTPDLFGDDPSHANHRFTGGEGVPNSVKGSVPLAERIRPSQLAEVVGQTHLLGPGKPLTLLFEQQHVHSLILWGPPGVGKTTLARLLAGAAKAQFIALSAVLSGVKEIRAAIDQASEHARAGKSTILFIDEIHRFNKSQQDALLPFVETGLVTFIGATTENPSFEVNSALLSRSQVYVLNSLSAEDFSLLLERAQLELSTEINVESDAFDALCAYADGDARRFLNLLEITLLQTKAQGLKSLDLPALKQIAPSQIRRFDKGGDAFYDQISALHKSVRGSDPDAALYWFCRMLDGGADPRYMARRIVRMAWEDIGLADPRAFTIANEAAQTYERLGSPEGELALAQCVLYLAVAAKSNAGYNAYKQAMAHVKQSSSMPVPMHLRNAPTKLMKELGHGSGYRYAHDEEAGHAAGESYWPDGLQTPKFYQPTDRGLEGKIAEKLNWLAERNAKAAEKK